MSSVLVGLLGIHRISVGWGYPERSVVSHQMLELYSLGLCLNDQIHTKKIKRKLVIP